jgi:putative addiction module component (TIGR02574 family)
LRHCVIGALEIASHFRYPKGPKKLAEIAALGSASAAEKIQRIDEIWASIARENLVTPDSHLGELARRVAAIQVDPSRALTTEEARRRIRKNTGL